MTADTVGGVWTYSIELARALSEAGVRVALATMGRRPSADQQSQAAAIPGLRLFGSEYRLPWMDDPWDDVDRAGDWLLDIEARVAPDVIHLSEPAFGVLPWRGPAVAVGHSCVYSWWEAVLGGAPPPSWERYRTAMRVGLAAVGEVVAPSRTMLEALRRHYGLTGGRVIRNGRDPARFQPGAKSAIVFAAGRVWDQAKNIGILDRVAARLPWPVAVAGDVSHPDGDDAFRPKHLELLGPLGEVEVAGWLARAAVYALPARYEPFGLSALEAALSRCALVLGDIPSLRELWDGAAVLVDPDDPAALEAAIRTLLEDEDLRRTLAMRARRRALGLTPQLMARDYLALYAELLARREVPACVS